MSVGRTTAAIVESLGATAECVTAAASLDGRPEALGSRDSLAARARAALAVRWSPVGRTPSPHVVDAIGAIAGDGRASLVAAATVLAELREGLRATVARATEALYVWAPLAARLGLAPLQREIEDRAFEIVDPGAYADITRWVAKRREDRDDTVAAARSALLAVLDEAGLDGDVTGRAKHVYSIGAKLRAHGDRAPMLHDLFGLRVIVSTDLACYAVLGAVHAAFDVVPGRFKDYVARPKANGYRSIHTGVDMTGFLPEAPRASVRGLDRIVEIQIRSREMHDAAEHGAASHLRYKHQGWDARAEGRWVYALTPRGEVRRLPAGSTPLDFAYSLHTEIGRRYTGAKVMGRIVTADTPLRTGDVVEILHSSRARASAGQLTRVCSPRARNRIRAAIRGA